MEQNVMDCFTHPIKCKLLLELYSAGKATAKQLAETYNDIPQATLYRHLKRMTNDGNPRKVFCGGGYFNR